MKAFKITLLVWTIAFGGRLTFELWKHSGHLTVCQLACWKTAHLRALLLISFDSLCETSFWRKVLNEIKLAQATVKTVRKAFLTTGENGDVFKESMCCCVGGGLKHKNLVVSSGLINSIQGVNRIEKLMSSANHWLKRRPATENVSFSIL